MVQVTIQSRLIASADTRQSLWLLMSKKNTPLINEILSRIKHHPDFPQWREKGRLPKNFIAQQIAELKNDPIFQGQPSRFYASVGKIIDYIYKSWFKVQRINQLKLEGNIRWLEMLKPDSEILKSFDGSMEALKNKAEEILAAIDTTSTAEGIANYLFEQYQKTEDSPIRDAIVYLIKNGCSVPQNRLETKEKYQKIKRKLEIKIQRLKRQIEMSIPSGRDLEGEKWLHTLILASNTMPVDDSESNSWFSALKRNSPSIPYPIVYETNEDLKWCLNEQNRIGIKFSGLSDHIFQIYCDSRQLPYFRRFYEDQELKKASKDQFSSALFTLRSRSATVGDRL